jgi:hypothetical protein
MVNVGQPAGSFRPAGERGASIFGGHGWLVGMLLTVRPGRP